MKRLDWNEIKSPGIKYRPMARWWWPGLDVDEKVLESQIDDLLEGGFGGAEIQAFLRGASHLDANNREQMCKVNRYGTAEYFEIIRKLMEKARKNGLLLELTAGSGYPLGDTEVEPVRDGMKAVIVGSTYVEGGAERKVDIMSAQTAFNEVIGPERSSSYMSGKMVVWSMDWPRMRRDLKLAHVTIARGDSANGKMQQFPEKPVLLDETTMKDVTGYVIDNVLTYKFPEGHWYVFASFEGPSYQRVKTDSRINPDKESYVVDHFSAGRIKPYLDRHIGRGFLDDYVGEPFRAFFLDSFELVGPYFWSEAFLTEFRNRRGYDLTPYLPVLMTKEHATDAEGHAIACFDIPNGMGERIRRDYDLTLADMFSEYFLSQATEWARDHGLKSRVQCYGHVMDPLLAYGSCDIPETEQLASAGLLDFMKTASSAAMVYDKPLATAEAFVWPGCDYMESPLRILMGSDKLTSAGIGQLLYHGMPYLHEGYEWPGYFAWHNSFGSFINRNSLLWPYIKNINTAIARNQYLTQEGVRVVDVCLYMGSLRSELPYTGQEFREELSDGEIPVIDRRERYGNMRFDHRCDRWQYVSDHTRRVALELTAKGYDYCHINGERLRKATIKNGKLTVGKAAFSALVLPSVVFIDLEVAKCVKKLVKAGFPVYLIDTKPKEAFGFKDAKANDKEVIRAFEGLEPVALKDISDALRTDGILPTVDFCGADNLDATHRAFDNADAYFIRSHGYEARETELKFRSAKTSAILLDARTGDTARVEGTQNGEWVSVKVPLTHFGAMWVLFTEDNIPQTDDSWLKVLKSSVSGECAVDIKDDWNLVLKSAVVGDEKQAQREHFKLMDWSDDEELKTYTGVGTYETAVKLSGEKSRDMVLDLGIVGDIAEVFVNGKRAGIRITPPYAFDLSGYLNKGENTIRVNVLNSLRNGMMGAKRVQTPHVCATSGLIGPVKLLKKS